MCLVSNSVVLGTTTGAYKVGISQEYSYCELHLSAGSSAASSAPLTLTRRYKSNDSRGTTLTLTANSQLVVEVTSNTAALPANFQAKRHRWYNSHSHTSINLIGAYIMAFTTELTIRGRTYPAAYVNIETVQAYTTNCICKLRAWEDQACTGCRG